MSVRMFAYRATTADEVIARAEAAGGSVVRKSEDARWGGYFGYFADPDGYLWKVATSG